MIEEPIEPGLERAEAGRSNRAPGFDRRDMPQALDEIPASRCWAWTVKGSSTPRAERRCPHLRRRVEWTHCVDAAKRADGGSMPNETPKDMHRDPRFWAVMILIWLGLILAVENIIAKIDLLRRMASE